MIRKFKEFLSVSVVDNNVIQAKGATILYCIVQFWSIKSHVNRSRCDAITMYECIPIESNIMFITLKNISIKQY